MDGASYLGPSGPFSLNVLRLTFVPRFLAQDPLPVFDGAGTPQVLLHWHNPQPAERTLVTLNIHLQIPGQAVRR